MPYGPESFSQTFDPLQFFQLPTLGSGAVIDLTGRLVRRCIIETRGEPSPEFGALHFDERYIYDDGTPDDVMHWAVNRVGERLEAHEPSVEGAVASTLDGVRWRVVFRRMEPAALTFDVTFIQVAPDTVIKLVKLKRFGLTLARLHGFHRQRL